jgi:hypothetical protein
MSADRKNRYKMPHSFAVGQHVHRIEDREVTGAVILSISGEGDDVVVELQYDEGGVGWWPVSAIRAD